MSDYNFLMESRLSPEQYRVLSRVSQLAAEQGLNLYLVGGAVRDLTWGQQVVSDLDFSVEGNPQRILRGLESRPAAKRARSGARLAGEELAPLVPEYKRFDSRLNSAEIRFTNGTRAELSMSRQEIYRRPGQRPEVLPAMIFDDLKRRDFSVNAMAVSLHPNSRGLLLDPTNGAADIERQEVRVLHSRSLLEDPSRIYRLLRLSLRLNFKPEEKTKGYLESALESGAWQRLDPEQQGRELRAILYEHRPARILKALTDRRLLAGLDKPLASARIAYDRFARVRAAAQDVRGADPFLLNFDCLVGKLGRAQKVRLAKKIIGEKKAIKMTLGLEREAKKLARILGSAKAKLPSQVYALLSTQPTALLLYLRVSSPKAVVQIRLRNYLTKYTQVRARLPRAELQGLGVKPGALFEKILERTFVEQLDGKIKTHQQLIKRMRELGGIPEPPPKPAPKPAKPSAKTVGKAAGPAPEKHAAAPAVAKPPAKPTAKPSKAPVGPPPKSHQHPAAKRR